MQKHTKIYLKHFGYGEQEFIPCEGCGAEAVDIHHINGRIGEDADTITNLIALCRKCHDRAHNSKRYVSPGEFQLIHNYFLNGTRRKFI